MATDIFENLVKIEISENLVIIEIFEILVEIEIFEIIEMFAPSQLAKGAARP